MKIINFGETVEGYTIPVLNEREIRAGAGILFLMMYTALMLILFKGNFIIIKYGIIIFLTDLLIRVFINPKFSPILILGRLIVRNQTPQYVGAKQKKFAWLIGITLGSLMFVMFDIINAYRPPTGLTCLVCLILLFCETAFGICVGCKIYGWIYKEKAQYCPGEICDIKSRQEIQKTSVAQIFIVLGLVLYIYFISLLFNGSFIQKPHDLFGINKPAQTQTK